MVTIGDDLLRKVSPAFGPKIEALVVYNSNPVAVAPESGKVAQGFAREDLFTVVLEHFQTDTADYADYILPATTQLEHWDVHLAYGHTDVLLNQPAIAPQGQARSNAHIFRDLAAHMGFTEPCFADSDEDLCRQAYGAQVDFNQLLAQGFAPLGGPDAPFAEGASHAFGPLRILQRAPGRAGPGWAAGPCAQPRGCGHINTVPAGHDLAARAQLSQFHLRERAQPAGVSRSARCWKSTPKTPHAAFRRAAWCACSTTGAATAATPR